MIEPDDIERSEIPGGGGGMWLINHMPTILWHRRMYVIVSFVLLFLIGLITAYTLPTMYRSSATMLVESQDLPENVVEAPGTGQIEQRIAKIREQVLSRGDLISLIEQRCNVLMSTVVARRPAVVQEPGFSDWLPTGEGLLSFSTPAQAADALEQVASDWERHAVAARALVAEHFDAAPVCAEILEAAL